MEMKIKLQPFQTPNFVLAVPRPGLKQDGMIEAPKWPLSDVEESTLSELCDQFRHDVFIKAGKTDPRICSEEGALTPEQKAKSWDRLKVILEKGSSDEEQIPEARDVFTIILDNMQELEQQIIKKDSNNDGATGA